MSDPFPQLTLRSPGASWVRVRAFNNKIEYMLQRFRALLIIKDFKIAPLVQNLRWFYRTGWILPNGEVVLWRVCTCSLRRSLYFTYSVSAPFCNSHLSYDNFYFILFRRGRLIKTTVKKKKAVSEDVRSYFAGTKWDPPKFLKKINAHLPYAKLWLARHVIFLP